MKSSEFVTLTNQANIVLLQDPGQVTSQYYLHLKQGDVRKYQCVMIVALLIEARLGMIRGTDDVYIKLSYQQELEKQSKIQSDLSHFRTLLGESNEKRTMKQSVHRVSSFISRYLLHTYPVIPLCFRLRCFYPLPAVYLSQQPIRPDDAEGKAALRLSEKLAFRTPPVKCVNILVR